MEAILQAVFAWRYYKWKSNIIDFTPELDHMQSLHKLLDSILFAGNDEAKQWEGFIYLDWYSSILVAGNAKPGFYALPG